MAEQTLAEDALLLLSIALYPAYVVTSGTETLGLPSSTALLSGGAAPLVAITVFSGLRRPAQQRH